MNINVQDRVTLISFHGQTIPPNEVRSDENYWKLIGLTGVVLDIKSAHPAYPEKGVQFLVRFNSDVKVHGLHCHNSIENSLWIFASDLQRLDQK